MTRMIVVRHAQSEGNFGPIFTGHTNVFLTKHGHRQAQATARFLDAYPADVAVSSDLIRVQQTARPTVERQGLDLILEPGLRELYCGLWEGQSYPWIQAHYPKEWDVWVNNTINTIFPGGESVQEMCNRVQNTFARIAKQYEGKTVLVFTHCTPLRTMLTRWKKQSMQSINKMYFPYNASVTVVRYEDDGSYTLELEAYDEHLKQAGLYIDSAVEKR